ncbi:MAG: class I SAM-dependent methyltransferase [Candidatus Hodarchaeota archaeon]
MNHKEHKAHVSGVFTRMASSYDQVGFRFFSHFGKRLVERIGIPENAKVLDIATGRGASLFPACEKVGSKGYVIGIDLAEGMVKATGNAIKKMGISNAKVEQMDAENLTYQNETFDFVLCGFSLFFFPNYKTALREAFRVLKVDGKIGISTFYQQSPSELKWLWLLLQKYTSPRSEERRAEKTKEDPGFGTTDGMRKMVSKAGFNDVYHEIEEKQFKCRNTEELWEHLWAIYTRDRLEKLSPASLKDLKEEIKINYSKYSQEGILFNTVGALFTFGKKRIMYRKEL